MAHYAWFNGCISRESAARFDQLREQDQTASGPELESRYSFPLFWLAGFAPEDQLVVSTRVKAVGNVKRAYTREFVVLCASATRFAERLRRRRTEVLRLLPPQYAAFYDEWTDFITAQFRECVLLNTSDIFAMDDDEASNRHLIRSLQAFEPADRGENITDIGAFTWATPLPESFMAIRGPDEDSNSAALGWRQALAGYSSYRDRSSPWPGPPTKAEVDAAAAVPMETVRYAKPVLDTPSHHAPQPVPFVDKLQRLLTLLTTALLGSILFVLGIAFSWVSAQTPGKFLLIGIALLAGGGLLLTLAWRQVRRW